MVDEPEVEHFGAARLTREILRADAWIQRSTSDSQRRRWCWYRERCLDWRYAAVRGVTVPRVVCCPRCLRLFTPRRTVFASKCWLCGRPWMFS